MRKILVAVTVLAVLLAGTPALANDKPAKTHGGSSVYKGPVTGGGMWSPGDGSVILGPVTGGGMW